MQDKIEGYVEHIVFRNEENGYTVLNLTADGEEVTCVGIFGSIAEGEMIEAQGQYTEHATYGQQFKIQTYETKLPQDTMAIERYLGSGAIRGVGMALAARIVRRFASDTMRILEEEPERLSEVKGISDKKAREIAAQVSEKSEMQSAMIFLQQYGISLSLGVKIYNKYGNDLYSVLRENPYKLADDIDGVGFKIADEIAARAGIRRDSEYRIRCGMYYVLMQASADGHVYLPKEVLFAKAAGILEVSPELMERCLMDLMLDRKVIAKEVSVKDTAESVQVIYPAQYYYLELDIARMLKELNISCGEDEKRVERQVERLESRQNIQLDDMQRLAVLEAVKNGLFVLTGGPGTGKTTTINAIIQYFESEGLDILLAAPTGRAAKRMTEATGYEASTIHRMLELSGVMEESSANVRFERNEMNPLEADVIIIDEMSMVDVFLMHALLSAVMPGTRLILVGDMNQLPSVGPGSVLRDIIQSESFPVVELKRIFRQAIQSDIVVNAHKIHAGEKIVLNNKSRDFFFLKRLDTNVILKVIVMLVSQKLPRYVDAKPRDIQVLTPMRKGVLGVENLNVILQRYLNPPGEDKAEKETAHGLFREGDKVMQIKNDYQLEWEIRGKSGIAAEKGMGVFNGDMGIIREINSFAEMVTVEYEEGRFVDYAFKQLDELELAYAVTIHKSQGSEYPAVVIPLLGGPRMLMTRNLLYTAVTRARKCVTVVGSDVTFQAMIDNKMEQNRYTALAQRIKEFEI